MRWFAATVALVLAPGAAMAACPDVPTVARLAASILDRRPAESFGPSLTMEDAACARDRLIAVLAQPYGDVVGYKVGLTSQVAQQRFGVNHPVRGTIFHGTLREHNVGGRVPEVPAAFGAVPVIESDLIVRVSSDAINDAGTDHVAILRNLDQVIPFLEMPDLVYGPGQLANGPNLVAINVGARLGVLGEPIPVRADADFAARLGGMTVVLASDQREIARAPGTALLGHPLNVIPWLIEDLRRDGRRLRAGEYISLGSFSPLTPTEAGRTYTATYEGLLDRPVTVSVRTP
ncbi:2-keto-4-pentenoate hydratase [Muricoccus radiodurans]|uniref:2-keto-4-pentenoate hydratase n=1 Tax=Muricoccus radiodurans TaxID=2231721 RepID=UPI003CEAD931